MTPAPIKILSWNVNGLRSIIKKGTLEELVQLESPDVLCLQEIRCPEAYAHQTLQTLFGNIYPCILVNVSKERKGYSGTAILSRLSFDPDTITDHVHYDLLGISTEEEQAALNREGRMITLNCPKEKLTVVCCYTPNAGQGKLDRLPYRINTWDPAFQKHIQLLLEQRIKTKGTVVVCGDLNVAHQDIDIYKPDAAHAKHAGFTPEERTSFDTFLKSSHLIDTYRALHPDTRAYSWWSNFGQARARDHGWRIDYILLHGPGKDHGKSRIQSADILTTVTGSDHAPVRLSLTL